MPHLLAAGSPFPDHPQHTFFPDSPASRLPGLSIHRPEYAHLCLGLLTSLQSIPRARPAFRCPSAGRCLPCATDMTSLLCPLRFCTNTSLSWIVPLLSSLSKFYECVNGGSRPTHSRNPRLPPFMVTSPFIFTGFIYITSTVTGPPLPPSPPPPVLCYLRYHSRHSQPRFQFYLR